MLWFKFDDSSWNVLWVIAWIKKAWRTDTDTGDDNSRRPRVKKVSDNRQYQEKGPISIYFDWLVAQLTTNQEPCKIFFNWHEFKLDLVIQAGAEFVTRHRYHVKDIPIYDEIHLHKHLCERLWERGFGSWEIFLNQLINFPHNQRLHYICGHTCRVYDCYHIVCDILSCFLNLHWRWVEVDLWSKCV